MAAEPLTTTNLGLKRDSLGKVVFETSFKWNMDKLDEVIGDVSTVTGLDGDSIEEKLADVATRLAALEA